MQKKLIALAIATMASLAAVPALAQSTNVTMYGLVDVGAEIGNSGFGTKTRIQSGQSARSRIGFKGEEDLGNGLKAYFLLEAGFALDNGQATQNSSYTGSTGPMGQGANTGAYTGAPQTTGSYFFQQQALAGLKGNFGQLSIGRQYTPAYLQTVGVDPFSAGLGGQMPAVLNGLPAYGQRYDNSALYVSPNFSGFTGKVMYSSGMENNTNTSLSNTTSEKAGRAWTIAGQYANGPASVGLSYQEAYTTSMNISPPGFLAVNAPELGKAKSWLLDGSWDFNVVKVSALYAEGHTDASTVGRYVDERRWALGLSAPVGANAKIQFTYGDRNDKTVWDADVKFWSLGGEYAISKRTALYAAYTKLKNEDRSVGGVTYGAGWNINSASNTGLQIPTALSFLGLPIMAGSYDPYAFQVGMRHSF